MSFRTRLYDLLELHSRNVGRLTRSINAVLFIIIIINVIAVILESEEDYRIRYAELFYAIELFSVMVFTVEYLLRLWVSAEDSNFGSGWRGRVSYMLSPMAMIDLLAILPFYLSMFVSFDSRILRVFRLFRLFKLSRSFAVLEILGNVMRNEAKTLLAAIFVLMILVILAAAGIYLTEHAAQPESFGSIPRAMWWATVTLTTVGYGDVVPITVMGRLFGVAITILGVGMAALPAGIIASGFTSELARRREAYELAARKIMMDGEIDSDDRQLLIKIRKELDLGRNEALQLLRKISIDRMSSNSPNLQYCPHCGKKINI